MSTTTAPRVGTRTSARVSSAPGPGPDAGTSAGTGAVVVAVDGSPADLPALVWAAEEAELARRPILLTHAAGHLPPEMSYADRHVAREQRRAASRRILEEAARWVNRLVPGVPVETMVRLLQPSALLPAVGKDAYALARTAEAWRRERARSHEPVVAALGDSASDAYVLDFAAHYADRRGLDLMVLEGRGTDVPRRVLERSRDTSLLLMPSPRPDGGRSGMSWPVAHDLLQRSMSPVVLVTDPDATARRAPGRAGRAVEKERRG